MERIGIRELRQNASEYVRGIKAGQSYEITERGGLVGYLVPATGGSAEIERLVLTGLVIPPRRARTALPELVELPKGEPKASEVLAAARAEER